MKNFLIKISSTLKKATFYNLDKTKERSVKN